MHTRNICVKCFTPELAESILIFCKNDRDSIFQLVKPLSEIYNCNQLHLMRYAYWMATEWDKSME